MASPTPEKLVSPVRVHPLKLPVSKLPLLTFARTGVAHNSAALIAA